MDVIKDLDVWMNIVAVLGKCGHLNNENSWNGEDIENPGRFLDPVFKVEEEKAKEGVEKEEQGTKTHINLVKMCGVPGS